MTIVVLMLFSMSLRFVLFDLIHFSDHRNRVYTYVGMRYPGLVRIFYCNYCQAFWVSIFVFLLAGYLFYAIVCAFATAYLTFVIEDMLVNLRGIASGCNVYDEESPNQPSDESKDEFNVM